MKHFKTMEQASQWASLLQAGCPYTLNHVTHKSHSTSNSTHLLYSQWFSGDVGFSSACCQYVLLSFINKEAALVYGWAKQSQAENLNRDRVGRDKKKTKNKKHHVTAEEERCKNLTGESHFHVNT